MAGISSFTFFFDWLMTGRRSWSLQRMTSWRWHRFCSMKSYFKREKKFVKLSLNSNMHTSSKSRPYERVWLGEKIRLSSLWANSLIYYIQQDFDCLMLFGQSAQRSVRWHFKVLFFSRSDYLYYSPTEYSLFLPRPACWIPSRWVWKDTRRAFFNQNDGCLSQQSKLS